MDFTSAKKRFLFASYALTVGATAALAVAGPGHYVLAMVLIVVSNFGYSVGESFASSFLPDLGPRDELGKISGFAWGLGYFGGLTSTLAVNALGASADAADFAQARWAGPITAGFFLLAAVPTFLWLKQRGQPQKPVPGDHYLLIGFRRLARTVRELGAFRDLAVFLVAVFFAMAGMSIIISFAFLYGEQVLNWSKSSMVLMFVLTQVTAATGAVLFGILQDRIGAKRTFQITLGMWVACVMAIWGVQGITDALNAAFGVAWEVERVFLGLGCVAGLGIGSTQSASRAMVGILSPDSKAGEFFGFWGLAGRLASIFGLVSFGLLQYRLGLRPSIPLCAVLFLLALIVTLPVREARGRQVAESHSGM